jgi:O-antigen/teichoic acid export membrane protein
MTNNNNVRNAIKLSLIMQIISKLIAFISVIMVARLLTPDELGVFAIVSAFTIIFVDLRFFGTGNYLIKEREVTEGKRRAVLGVSLVISVALGVILLIVAPLLARYFNYADITPLFQIMSISFFVAPFFLVPHSMMMKEYNFKYLLIINTVSNLITLIMTVLLINLGFSYFSLAISMNITIFCNLFLTFLLVPQYMIFKPTLKESREIINFGGFNSLSIIFNRLAFVAPDIIIGKLGTAKDVAIYSRGMGFLDFLAQVLTMGFQPVALPYLSNSIHANENVNQAYLRATNLLGSICWPIMCVATISAYPLIMLLFGEQWKEAVPLVFFLGVWMLFKMIHILSPSLFMAANKYKLLFYKALTIFILTALAIVISYSDGLLAIAKAMAIVGIIDFLITTVFLKVYFNLHIKTSVKSILPNIILTALCGGLTYGISNIFDFYSNEPVISLLLIALVNIPIWIVMTKLLKLEIYIEIKRAMFALIPTSK